ncbi:hypothetical protein [Dactylosporangium sp. CA-233914]|uniref:hypothetical protein n=1 Tax=Dactylosporangium sp. CA-233914 TaxID=3239934 RepID=UPI003D8D3146
MQLVNGFLTANAEHVVEINALEFAAGRPVVDFSALDATFERCSFRMLRLEEFVVGSGSSVSEYVDCVFDGMQADLLRGRARFVRCSFRDVAFGRVSGRSISLIDCVFTGVLEDAEFCARDVGGDGGENEFRGNDFSDADLQQVGFRYGIDLSAQRLPEGGDYVYVADLDAGLAAARDAVLGWPAAQRDSAQEKIGIWTAELESGQRQLLLRRSLWGTDEAGRGLLDLFGRLR